MRHGAPAAPLLARQAQDSINNHVSDSLARAVCHEPGLGGVHLEAFLANDPGDDGSQFMHGFPVNIA
jgi:hypothetical protein